MLVSPHPSTFDDIFQQVYSPPTLSPPVQMAAFAFLSRHRSSFSSRYGQGVQAAVTVVTVRFPSPQALYPSTPHFRPSAGRAQINEYTQTNNPRELQDNGRAAREPATSYTRATTPYAAANLAPTFHSANFNPQPRDPDHQHTTYSAAPLPDDCSRLCAFRSRHHWSSDRSRDHQSLSGSPA